MKESDRQQTEPLLSPASGWADRPARLTSLDAYRGFIMMLPVSGGFGLRSVAQEFPDSGFWRVLGYQFDHVPWSGGAFWDLIQPAFLLMVGVSIPYSYAGRKARGDSEGRIMAHAAYRSIAFILLGVFLESQSAERTNWNFRNVLTQIGLGYAFVYLLRGRGPKVQFAALAAILVGDWLLFVLYPAPGPGFDYRTAGVPDDFERFSGLFAHWNNNTNVAARLDMVFLNLFPRPRPYRGADGWQTLNFIPNMARMIIGLMVGELLRGAGQPMSKLKRLILGGSACVVLGWALGQALCPLVRRLETPSYVLVSSGWVLLMMAAFYWIIDIRGHRQWAFPLVVLGMNSLALYGMASLGVTGWIRRSVGIHLGRGLYGGPYGPVVYSLTGLLGAWMICFWMYRRRIFLRI
jgi:heparan-alpha-glucosaminide N-acetyltransferase